MGFLDKILNTASSANPIGNAAKGVVEGVGGVVDKFVHTAEEQAELKAELEKEITRRWEADAAGKSWLSSNVRPLTLVWSLLIFTLMLFTDGNIGEFKIKAAYVSVFETILMAVIGGYFVMRSIDKRGKIR